MTEREILLQAEGLGRRYGERRAVESLDLTLRRGEVLGLLGPNGAGKSTTLRMLSGTLPPSEGSIRLAGVDLLEQPRRAKRALGYLPELPPLYPEQTVADYLRYCARLHGVARAGAPAAAAAAMARCGLSEVAGRLIGRLSKGYQQRVGIAQAIVHRPAVVILDEPTVGLDPLQMREIRALIGELRADHGVLLSSHILPEIQSVCDRVVILHRGRAVYSGGLQPPAHDGEREVLLGLGAAVEPAQLTALPGVLAVASVDGQRLRLRLASAEAATAVQRHVLAAGWELREWLPLERNLEQLFVSLTAGEVA